MSGQKCSTSSHPNTAIVPGEQIKNWAHGAFDEPGPPGAARFDGPGTNPPVRSSYLRAGVVEFAPVRSDIGLSPQITGRVAGRGRSSSFVAPALASFPLLQAVRQVRQQLLFAGNNVFQLVDTGF